MSSVCGATDTGGGAASPRADASAFLNLAIEKPATDYRDYRTSLLPNNLAVMVVSDAKCDRAAAAMSIGVGSLHDPREVPGLAHFIEHMLFLGTEKYPNESEYNEFLAKNGGASNAYTAETLTNFFFSVKPEALEGAVDRFAQFFISPLFTESATGRELQAVDSEHSKNLQQDGWRQNQLLRNSANPAHPLHHFMTGNSETLRDAPAKEGVDVRTALLDFHRKYYSANTMRLVIVGKESSEDLLKMASRYFSAIVDRGAVVPKNEEIGAEVEAFPAERRCRLVHVVPVNDVRTATFQFIMGGQKAYWRTKPAHYLAHLIGHEGEGSLFGALKRRGLATELMAGEALDEAGVGIFSVTVVLTEAGQSDIATVGELLFAYIRLLRSRGVDEALWRELQSLGDIGFRFRSLSDSLSTARSLAANLQEHCPEVALSAGSRLWDYKPELILEVLANLSCDNLRLVVSGKAHASLCTEEERWYGCKFADTPLPPELRNQWEFAGNPDNAAFSAPEDLVLPKPNPFVPKDLELRPASPSTDGVSAVPEPLSLTFPIGDSLEADQVASAYFRKDNQFQLPKAVCAFVFYCPFAAESVESRTLCELWCSCVAEELNEFAYEASVAGVQYSVSAVPFGCVLQVGGYNDKLPVLLDTVARKMASMTEIPESVFAIVKERHERDLTNAAMRSPPVNQAFSLEHCSLHWKASSVQERLVALKAVATGSQAISGVNRKLFGRCHVEVLAQGNLTADEARGLVRCVLEPLAIEQKLEKLPLRGSALLPSGVTLLEREGTNPDERNGAVIATLQCAEDSSASRCLMDLTGQVLGQRFFDELRTKQQLGYIVQAGAYSERRGSVGIRFMVQSEKATTEVAARMQEWMSTAWSLLEEQLTQSEFDEYRGALVSRLRERPKTLGEEFGRNWVEVLSRGYNFSRLTEDADHLETLTLEDLQRFSRENLRPSCMAWFMVSSVLEASSNLEREDKPPLGSAADRTWKTKEDIAAFHESAEWRWRNGEIVRRGISEQPEGERPARL